jgi:hypothetical protein
MKVPENIEDLRRNIQVQLADMSRLLEMMSNDDDVVHEARTSFLKLSVLIGRALDILPRTEQKSNRRDVRPGIHRFGTPATRVHSAD